MHVKKGDTVVILAGKEKGERGEIIDIDRKHGRVKVERRNMIVKNKKPNLLTGEEGAVIEKENWIDASNVLIFSEKLQKGVRTQARWVGKGGSLHSTRTEAVASFGSDAPERIQKVRYSVKSEETFGAVTAD